MRKQSEIKKSAKEFAEKWENKEILETRKEDSSCLASQYSLLKGRLAKAHKENDKVVAKAYDIDLNMSDEGISFYIIRDGK